VPVVGIHLPSLFKAGLLILYCAERLVLRGADDGKKKEKKNEMSLNEQEGVKKERDYSLG
jgi:hypothetical protein